MKSRWEKGGEGWNRGKGNKGELEREKGGERDERRWRKGEEQCEKRVRRG